MKSFMKHYKFESSIIFFELLFQNLLLLGSTLITMYMAKLVMEPWRLPVSVLAE